MKIDWLQVDIEPTNRCNANCYFCPRDATPHQGLMTPEVYRQSLDRVIELRDVAKERLGREIKLSLCGLGEPLLNRHIADFVHQARQADFAVSLSSNAALLDERRGQALLDAGVQEIDINVGEKDASYDEIYGLPFERTRDNVLRFAEMAGDACTVRIVLVNHRGEPEHLSDMVRFWRDHGIESFMMFDLINRGGALFVDHMQYESYPERAEALERTMVDGERAMCNFPFMFLFIGYDGNYYLCCSDWKKEVPLGSVFDRSFAAITADKVHHLDNVGTVCRTCNFDPVNQMTDELRALAAGTVQPSDVDALAERIRNNDLESREIISRLGDLADDGSTSTKSALIPVRSV